MSSVKNQFFGSFFASLPAVIALAALLLAGSAPAKAQNEKRTVFKESDFHWQASLKPGQTLEIIGRNGGIDATGTTGEAAQVEGIKQTNGDANEVFVEVVEYSDALLFAPYTKKMRNQGVVIAAAWIPTTTAGAGTTTVPS